MRVRGFIVRRWHLLATCALAALLRLPAVFNGLPYVAHPDEPTNYRVFHTMVENASALPHFYRYPSLLFDLQALTHGALVFVGRLFGVWSPSDLLGLNGDAGPGSHLVQSRPTWVVARLVIVAVSVAGAVLVAGVARRMTSSRVAGFVAGALASTSAISIASGSSITPDALAGTMAFAVIVMALQPVMGSLRDDVALRRWAITTGVILGLATAAKYNNAVLAVPIAAAIGLMPDRARFTWRHMGLVAGMGVVAFTLATPGLVFDTTKFVEDLGYELRHYSTGHDGAEGASFVTNLKFLWRSDAVAVVLAIVGLALRRSLAMMLLAVWPVTYLLVIGATEVRFARNLTPLLGCIAVLAAVGTYELAKLVRRRHAFVIAAVCLAPLVVLSTIDLANNFRRDVTDHHGAARRWLEDHVDPGSRVLADYYTPWLNRNRWEVTSTPFAVEQTDLRLYGTIVITSTGSGRFLSERTKYGYQARRIEALRSSACRVDRYDDSFGFWIEVLVMSCPADGE